MRDTILETSPTLLLRKSSHIQLPVPDVDRGPGDLLHVLAYITRINKAKSWYKLATKHRVLSGMYSRNQFHICKQQILKIGQLDSDNEFSLRQINGNQSITGGQGFSQMPLLRKVLMEVL